MLAPELGVHTEVSVRYPDVIVDRASSQRDSLACEAPIFLAVLSPSRLPGTPANRRGYALRSLSLCVFLC